MNRFLQTVIAAGICLAILSLQPGFAADAEPDNGSITGVVVDDSTSGPVSYASVALLSAADSSLLTGMITDETGKFIFEKIPYGKYNLRVTFIGYKTITVKDLEVTKDKKIVDLQKLNLVEDYRSLSEAVIVGQRLKGEEKVDRTVFTLNDDVRKASTSALDALKHIPSVTVDFQKNVTLEGQSNIQFYVDGVQRNKDYVAQIRPEMIDKIELITNPGVKYDADISGVINIVLIKESRYGVSGSIKVPIPYPGKVVADAGGNLEYGNARFRLYVGDQLHFERFNGSEILTTEVDGAHPYYFKKTGQGINSWQNNYMNYGIDWFIDEKTSLNFMGEWRNWKGVADNYLSDSKVYIEDSLDQYVKTGMNTLDKSDNYYFSLFFLKKLKKEGNEVRLEGYYNRQTGKAESDYTDTYIDTEDLSTINSTIDRTNVTNNLRNNGELKADFTFMLKNVKNETGLRSYIADMNSRFSSEYTVEDITDGYNETFSYLETRQTAYYNTSGKVKKTTWQAGLRGEYSWLDINSVATNDYAVLLPQVSFNQSLPKDQSMKITYRKQVFRPSINNLNPFEVYTDSLHMRKGNPDLEPALENRFELSYTKNFKSNYLSPKAYFRYTRNGIQDVTMLTDEGITMITQENIGKNMEYGISINTALQLMKRWRLNANFSVFNRIYKTDEAATGHSKEEMVSYRFNFSNIVTLPKDYTLFMFANYGSPNISYQREFSRDMLVIFGGEKKFSEKFSFEVFYNPFIKDFMYSKVITSAPEYRESWEGHVEVSHLFCFTLHYSFNKGGSKISKIDRAVEYERNEGKGGL
jgi:hypothetical protein